MILSFEDVGYTYHTLNGETEALKGLNFGILRGQFVSVIGPSGCGKSTILSLAAGLITFSKVLDKIFEKKKKPAEKPQRRDQEAAGEEEISIPLPEPEDLGEPCGADDEKAAQIRTFLEGLLQHMDSAAQVKVYQPEKGRYKVILEGEKLGALIGRRGETLDAIQQLTNYSVNRGSDKRVRIHVDAENYRLKREQSLQHLARKVAAKVIKYKRNVTLEPMNAYERHVIHTALQDVENVTTYSMGTEPNRRVIVAYDRENKG